METTIVTTTTSTQDESTISEKTSFNQDLDNPTSPDASSTAKIEELTSVFQVDLHAGDESSQRNRRVHPVWEHFTVTADNCMKCLLCGRIFKTTSSTTVCKHHLRSRHPDVANQLDCGASRDWRMKNEETATTISNGHTGTPKIEVTKKRPKQTVAPLVASVNDQYDASTTAMLFDYDRVLKNMKMEMVGSSTDVGSGSLGFIANLLCQQPTSIAGKVRSDDRQSGSMPNKSNSNVWAGLKPPDGGDVDDTKDESSPLGCLVVDLHRKLRETKKTHKALEFKRGLFNLISEFETELL